ncbi:DUF397 domain-containing protein [Streptomyces sp. NA02950]|uniref:DUF397 domain-containing protein n=1 Tax=Streptomyces sp. NA02950 TaxID=2742137 RepID=UPI0015911ED1|nr:DUF397 domain-containing protein [Streptomyces sp. NA02950]QKV92485.1 DUF397 domain-containing protein [Streptomyces sp. NA02950]
MAPFVFRKSSYSNGDYECVEVATNVPNTVVIRDSKNPAGPIVRCSPAAWMAFSAAVGGGQARRGE